MRTISLSDELAERVRKEADVRGISADAVVQMVLSRALPRPFVPEYSPTPALFGKWDREDEPLRTDDPNELVRRQRELDEFLRAIDRHADDKRDTE